MEGAAHEMNNIVAISCLFFVAAASSSWIASWRAVTRADSRDEAFHGHDFFRRFGNRYVPQPG